MHHIRRHDREERTRAGGDDDLLGAGRDIADLERDRMLMRVREGRFDRLPTHLVGLRVRNRPPGSLRSPGLLARF